MTARSEKRLRGKLPSKQEAMPDHADDNSAIDWGNFAKAWKALGLEPAAFPTTRVERIEHFAEPPLPPEPELEPPTLSDAEWTALAPLMPAKSKYLSKLAPREFLDLALFYVWCGRRFNLLPTERIERFRAKLYRAFISGTFAPLATIPPGSLAPLVSDEVRALLAELADAERVYRKRHAEFKVARVQKLAREKDRSKSRG